jgi:hypothetical protein
MWSLIEHLYLRIWVSIDLPEETIRDYLCHFNYENWFRFFVEDQIIKIGHYSYSFATCKHTYRTIEQYLGG